MLHLLYGSVIWPPSSAGINRTSSVPPLATMARTTWTSSTRAPCDSHPSSSRLENGHQSTLLLSLMYWMNHSVTFFNSAPRVWYAVTWATCVRPCMQSVLQPAWSFSFQCLSQMSKLIESFTQRLRLQTYARGAEKARNNKNEKRKKIKRGWLALPSWRTSQTQSLRGNQAVGC